MTARRRRRLLRIGDLASLAVALPLAGVPYLICLALVLLADLTPARADSRETPASEPEFRGVRANAPIPAHLHRRNEGGSDGAGLCVICSITINGRYQGVPGIDGLWPVAKSRPGGYSPGKLQSLLDEVIPAEKWASYVGTDPQVLDRLSAAGYPIGATMNTGALYGYRPIHHMVSLVHFDRAGDLACVVDNNQPGVYSWMSSREYQRRWVDQGTGWAFVWLRKAASATTRAHLLVIATAGALAVLAIRRVRARETPDE